jgi:hypothetical protein
MKVCLVLIQLILFSSLGLGQCKIDSLRESWKIEQSDESQRLESIKSLVEKTYLGTNSDSAILLSNILLQYSDSFHIIKYIAYSHGLLGRAYEMKD